MRAHTLLPKKDCRKDFKRKKNAFNPLNLYSSSFQTDMPKCMNKYAGEIR